MCRGLINSANGLFECTCRQQVLQIQWKKRKKALATKKQQSMSSYMYRFIASSALVSLCSLTVSDRKMIISVSPCYLSTLRCCPRCGSHTLRWTWKSCLELLYKCRAAWPFGWLERLRKLKIQGVGWIRKEIKYSNLPFRLLEYLNN